MTKMYWSKGMKKSLDGPVANLKRSDVTIPIKKIRDILGFSCIYAIGKEDGRPLKIGQSDNPQTRLHSIQVGNPDKMFLHHCIWLRCTAYAKIAEKSCHAILERANKHLSGEWFDINVEWAEKVIKFAADQHNYQLYTIHQVKEFLAAKKQLDEDALAKEIDLAVGRWAKEPLKSLEI